MAEAPFTPKQAYPRSAELLAELMGDVSYDMVIYALDKVIPPIQDGAIIHDNGSGPGPVTRAIVTRYPSTFITIYGTDLFEQMVQGYAASWAELANTSIKVESFVMDAEANTLPENSLSHSFLYFLAAGL